MAAERKHELILRIRGLSPEQAARMVETLKPFASRLDATLSEIVRDRYPDHEMNVSRKRHV